MLMKNEKNKRYELLTTFYNRFSSDTEAVTFFIYHLGHAMRHL